MITCTNLTCRAIYPDSSKFCPQCGTNAPPPQAQQVDALSQQPTTPPPPPPPSRVTSQASAAAPASPAKVAAPIVKAEIPKPVVITNASQSKKEEKLAAEPNSQETKTDLKKVFFFVAIALAVVAYVFPSATPERSQPLQAGKRVDTEKVNIPQGNVSAAGAAWTTGGLYGSDNEVAALKTVRISQNGNSYQVLISNQFAFNCMIEFNSAGDPTRLINCQSSDSSDKWRAIPDVIQLTCNRRSTERVCQGRYTLISPDGGYQTESTMTIASKR